MRPTLLVATCTPVHRLQDVLMIKSLVTLKTVRGCSLGHQLFLLHVPSPQQDPARAIKECRHNGQAC